MTRWIVAFALAFSAMACGGYSQRLAEVRVDARVGAFEDALVAVDQLVLRGQEGRSPYDRDLPLLLLERGAILQALGRHVEASADLAAADAMLEVLDLTPDRAGQAAEYLFSGSRKLYRPPVYEKLMVNAMALSSYLGDGQIRSAMVEARRIRVLLDYFQDTDVAGHPMLATSAFLAGVAMERGGEESDALRNYLDAWAVLDAPGLPEAIVRLGTDNRFAPNDEVARARAALGLAEGEMPAERGPELVTIAFSGLPPYRVAQRLPVGVVFAWMRQNAQYSLGEERQSVYNRILAEGLLTWVNFPSLVIEGPQLPVDVQVDGRRVPAMQVADVAAFAVAQWESERPGVAFAAITRAITRVLAREAIQAATSQGNDTVEVVGFLASLATQGAMQAADQPDTRTWTLMPGAVWVARTPIDAGSHRVAVTSGSMTTMVDVQADGERDTFAVVRVF